MIIRPRLIPVTLAVLLAAAARPAASQRSIGFGNDASTLPAGFLRVTAGAVWERANERYDADGKLRPLGVSAAPWNGAYDARLATAGSLVASLAGLGGFDASLGTLRIARRDASADAVLGIEAGILSRLTVGARLRVASHAIEPSVVLNPGRTEGTMGLNPGWFNTTARDRNALLVAQFDSAVAQSSRRIAQCQAAPAGSGCAAITGNVAGAQALVTNATAFATALSALYGGRRNAAGSPFVPVGASAAQQAIAQRVLGFRDQFAAIGNGALGTQGPVGSTQLSLNDLATLLSDSLYGYRLRPLRAVHAYGIGELAVHAKARIFQTTGSDTASIRGLAVRQALGVSLRLSGGAAPPSDEVFAPQAGAGGSAYAVQSFTDLFYGSRYSATVVIGYEASQAQEYAARIASTDAPGAGGVPFPFVAADREVRLARTPGARLDVSVTPRLALTRNLWLGASWALSRQSADRWAVAAGDGARDTTQDAASAWAAGTDWSAQHVGLGGSYSTVEAVRRGRAQLAFDVSYEHQQALVGRGWRAAGTTRDVVTVRWYPRLWGR